MAYAQFGQIQAVDFNTLTGGPTSTAANTLNATWATGTSSAGYGQTAVANVTAGATVAASDWNQLVVATANAAAHQGSSITSVTAPVSGGTVSFLSAVPTNLQTIYTNRLNALAQGSSVSNVVTRATSWSSALTFTHTVTFANATAARYFFNSGGQIKLQTEHNSTVNVQNSALRTLAIATGTVVLSSVTSGTANIASSTFNGVTKVGGSGSATIATNTGYYALTTTSAQLFRQNSTTTGYTSSTITYNAAVNSNILTITTVVDIAPNSSMAANVTKVTLQAFYPSTTYLANTWGTVTLAGSVTGS